MLKNIVATDCELSIVVPCYKSADCIEALADAIEKALVGVVANYELILVNDCSPDNTWHAIETARQTRPWIIGVDLRRNFGQDNALITGMRLSRGRYVVIMDDDLQHDPADLPKMIAKLKEGYDVVYADFRVRKHKLWKQWGSWFNGKVAEWVIDKPPHVYLSPYKVMVGDVARGVAEYHGPHPYIDGLIFQITTRITQIPAEHHDRFAGKSTYTLIKSIRVWGRLTFSFSIKPLRLVTWFGLIQAVVGLVLALGVVFHRVFFPEHFPQEALGWASLMVAQLVLGGMQMMFFGILGEYAGRTYLRVNEKPQASIRVIRCGDSVAQEIDSRELWMDRASRRPAPVSVESTPSA